MTARVYEPLATENAAVTLIDNHVDLMTVVRGYTMGEPKHNVVALTKAATVLDLPIALTTTSRDSLWGSTFPELVDAIPGTEIIGRSLVNAYDDPRVAAANKATGRRKLMFACISLEVCAAFLVMTAVARRLDASGTFSEAERQAGLLRMQQAAVAISDCATFMIEILKDHDRAEAGAV